MLGIPMLGLPGNPVSAVITLDQLAQPALRKLSGESVKPQLQFSAVVKSKFRKKAGGFLEKSCTPNQTSQPAEDKQVEHPARTNTFEETTDKKGSHWDKKTH